MSRRPAALLAVVVVVALGVARDASGEAPAPADGWRSFAGSWSATGTRQTVATEGDRPAGVVRLAGAIAIASGEGLGRGFRGEAVYFDDGKDLGVGRAVWTDERGDRIFFELRGEPTQTGRRITATITGGTGRYARLEGSYTMTWQFVVEAEEGVVQGRSADLAGKYRVVEGPR